MTEMTESGVVLAIPDTSIGVLIDIANGYYDGDPETEEDVRPVPTMDGMLLVGTHREMLVRRVAAPVVAAELRRIADLDPSWTICGPATFLRARADELDPPATEED